MIAHADDADLLRRCIVHHLGIGVDYVFISLNLDDPESASVAGAFASANVRAARLATFAPDAFDYFTAALRAVTAWAAPDWVLFVDSDEFWLPASGSIHGTRLLREVDAYSVARYNVPPIRRVDGALGNIESTDTTTLMIGSRISLDADYLAAHPETPWIYADIGPKIMVRSEVAESIGVGAHDFVSRNPGARSTVPADLIILHLPFTNESRFRRKVDAIRVMLTTHADRYRGGMAWHWRRWVAVAQSGRVQDEFAAQIVDQPDVCDLLSRGILTTPAQLFAGETLPHA